MPNVARGTRLVFASSIALAMIGSPERATGVPWTALHFSTGTSFNHTLAVGDLNGDGKLDVACPNSPASVITVLLGQGDGTLAPFQTYATSSDPQDVVMADLTGDGVPDLAAPVYTGGDVAVLPGLGDGTFAPQVIYPVGPGLVSLAAVDLDRDGRLDLAVSKESGSKVAVLPALPGGGFGTAIEVASGATPHQIATADFDRDGDPDLVVVSNGAASVSIHLGNATLVPGAATPFAAGGSPVGISLSDLNLDGSMDLFVSNVNAATVSVLLGNGDGTFRPPVAYPTDPRPRGMDAGDLDGDGVPDLVIATGYPDGDSVLTVYRGRIDGTLTVLDHIRLPYRAADCVIADMNGDGRRDIVATGPHAGVVSVLLNPLQTTGVPPDLSRALRLELEIQPLPGRAPVTLRFRSPAGAEATLEIFDPAGRRIVRFGPFDGGADAQVTTWSGERSDGGRSPAGVYLARLSAGGAAITRRLVLIPR